MRVIKGGRTSGAKDEHDGHARLHRARPASARTDAADFEGQLEALKDIAALLRAELADMRAQRDHWRTKAEENKLAIFHAIASRARRP